MGIAEMYVAAQRSFCALFTSLTDAERALPVPCNPDWSVRDVLSHVAGVAVDITSGNVEGAATDPWTAAQVDRWRQADWQELIDRWAHQAPTVGAMLGAVDEGRPPLDCHTHEHDVRHAVGRPGNRDSELIRWMASLFDGGDAGRAVDVHLDDGARVSFDGELPRLDLRGISRFELVRSRLGRRSRSQVVAYDWSEQPDDVLLRKWFVFGPSIDDIDE